MAKNRRLTHALLLTAPLAATLLTGCGDDGPADGVDTDDAATTGATDDSGDPSTGTDPDTTDTETDGGDETDGGGELVVPDVYAFESRFEDGASSVSYGGQTFRQVLIESLVAEMDLVQTEIDQGTVFEAGQVAGRLSFYVDFDPETSNEVPHLVATMPAPLQSVFGDISSGANLVDKIAGNDPDPQHQDWSSEMIGWDASGSPEGLIRDLIDACDALAVAYSSGQIPLDPDGAQIPRWFISAEGLDHQQLLQKFLLGAVNYSQGTDDYLDDASDNGLNSDNTMPDGDASYTSLEHQWDEGFGYWGAARNYLEYSDDEIANADGRAEFVDGYNDLDGDGAIDLRSEMNFSASVNAGKRDRGAAALGVTTDYTEQTMRAFLTGRAIISHADGPLSEEASAALREQRDLAVDGWERALAATAIHYFNDTIRDTLADEYSFVDHAKHWGELKGFLLTLQFNPRAQVSDADLTTIHELVGTAPVLPGQPGTDAYVEALLEARDLLAGAYGFEAALVGDEVGENGW